MKKWQRVLWEILGPAAIAATLLIAVVVVSDFRSPISENWVGWVRSVFSYWLLYLMVGYVFAGIPSILYALVMEWRFARGLDPASGKSIILSASLGALSGAVIVIVMFLSSGQKNHGAEQGIMFAILTALGLAVGAILGGFICWRTRVERRKSREVG